MVAHPFNEKMPLETKEILRKHVRFFTFLIYLFSWIFLIFFIDQSIDQYLFFFFFCHAFHDTGNPIWPPGLYFLNLVFIWLFFPYHFVFVVCFCTQLTVLLFFQTPGYYPWMHEQNKLVNGEYHIVLFVISSFFLICFVHIFAIKFLFIFCMIWVGCLFFECRWYWLHWRNAYFLILFHVMSVWLLWRRDEMRPIRCSVDKKKFINHFMFLLLF
jgi:hypothetical protein